MVDLIKPRQIETPGDPTKFLDGTGEWSAPASGGGGGAGFRGGWVSMLYAAGEMVIDDGILWAARIDTTAEPQTSATTTTDVTGAAYSRNSVASSSGGEVVIINNVTSDNGTVISTETFTGWDGVTVEFDVWIGGTADYLDIGILDSAQAATVNPGTGMSGQTGFYGVKLDTFNNKIDRYVNGTAGGASTQIAHEPDTSGAYEKWQLTFTDLGTNMKLELRRAAGATLLTTWTFTKPSFTTYRLAVGAKTGGSAGTFKVRNSPTVKRSSGDWGRICNVLDTTWNPIHLSSS